MSKATLLKPHAALSNMRAAVDGLEGAVEMVNNFFDEAETLIPGTDQHTSAGDAMSSILPVLCRPKWEIMQSLAKKLKFDSFGWDDRDEFRSRLQREATKARSAYEVAASYCSAPTNTPVQAASLFFGANFSSCLEQAARVERSILLNASNLMPLSVGRNTVDRLIGDIILNWNKLRHSFVEREEKESLDGKPLSLDRHWASLDKRLRQEIVGAAFPQLDESPSAYIADWAHRAARQQSPSDGGGVYLRAPWSKRDFVGDLALPELVVRRVRQHPRHFLSADSPSVLLGIWIGGLPVLRFDGRAVLSSSRPAATTAAAGGNGYGIRCEDSILKNASSETVCHVIYRLKAQAWKYEGMVRWLCMIQDHDSKTTLPRECPSPPLHRNNNSLFLHCSLSTILEQSLLLQYGTVAAMTGSRLDEMIKAVLETAKSKARLHLRRLRSDALYWFEQASEIQCASTTRAQSLLKRACTRIDSFSNLCDVIDNVGPFDEVDNAEGVGDDETLLDSMAVPFGSLLCVQNDLLSSAATYHEPLVRVSKESINSSPLLSQLENILKKDDPVARLLGIRPVLQQILRELASGCTILDNNHGLSDLLYVAFCLEHLRKLFVNYSSTKPDQFMKIILEGATHWRQTLSGHWTLAMDLVLDGIRPKTSKMNAEIMNLDVSVEERHCRFWATVDSELVALAGDGNLVAATILDETPIPKSARMHVNQPDNIPEQWGEGFYDTTSEVTSTMIKKSKGSRVVPPIPASTSCLLTQPAKTTAASEVLPTASAAADEEERGRMVAKPKVHVLTATCRATLARLRNGAGTIEFDDWCKFLTQIGFTMDTPGGSIHRFTLMCDDGSDGGSVVFHRPHGSGDGGRLRVATANKLWLHRLEDRFELVIAIEN